MRSTTGENCGGGGTHYQGDIFDMLNQDWDLIILHPTCTYVCVSGLHWNKRVPGREEKTLAAIAFTEKLVDRAKERSKKVVVENPVGCLSTRSKLGKATQIIQPYEFGDDASKKTCLWIYGLEKLKPTKFIAPRIVEWPRGSGKFVKRWANQTDSGQNNLPPSANRWDLRSETYPGIAEAIAEQMTC